jgi:ethanolamine utilization protein EutQ (cupin superfamily)
MSGSDAKVFHLQQAVSSQERNTSVVQTYVDDSTQAPFAAGLAIYQDFHKDWQLWYDEILFCHRTERVFSVVIEGVRHDLHAGDSIWLPAGTRLTYISEGRSWVFFSVAPANWRDTRPADLC